MLIVTEFSARFDDDNRRHIGVNGRQRKMSSLAAHAFASISFDHSFREQWRTS
jgi:hypothetical protein